MQITVTVGEKAYAALAARSRREGRDVAELAATLLEAAAARDDAAAAQTVDDWLAAIREQGERLATERPDGPSVLETLAEDRNRNSSSWTS